MKLKQKIAACAATLLTANASAGMFAPDPNDQIGPGSSANTITINVLQNIETLPHTTATIEHRSSLTIDCTNGTYRVSMQEDRSPADESTQQEMRQRCLTARLKPGLWPRLAK